MIHTSSSEHSIDGDFGAMEMQFVHYDDSLYTSLAAAQQLNGECWPRATPYSVRESYRGEPLVLRVSNQQPGDTRHYQLSSVRRHISVGKVLCLRLDLEKEE